MKLTFSLSASFLRYSIFLSFISIFVTSCSHKEKSPARGIAGIDEDYSGRFPNVSENETYPYYSIQPQLGEEIQEGELEAVIESMDAIESAIKTRMDKGLLGRGDHSTSHGCYKTKIRIKKDIPENLRVGMFDASFHGEELDGVMRFSNSEKPDREDYKSASMGIGAKVFLTNPKLNEDYFLLGEENKGLREQDFTCGSNKVFMVSNIMEYGPLMVARAGLEAGEKGRSKSVLKAIAAMGPIKFWKLVNNRGIAPVLKGVNKEKYAPIFIYRKFFGALPYRWGDDRAAKFGFVPCEEPKIDEKVLGDLKAGVNLKSTMYQKEMINNRLKTHDICYNMVVQLRPKVSDFKNYPKNFSLKGAEDEINKKFPIEDANVMWPDCDDKPNCKKLHSPWVPVAEFRVTKGTKPLDHLKCEKMVFNPWNGLKEHQPLGSLSRGRLAVYKRSSSVRHSLYKGNDSKVKSREDYLSQIRGKKGN